MIAPSIWIRLASCIRQKLGRPSLHVDERFGDDLKLDSLDFLDLMLAIETEFGIEIPESAMVKFQTPGDVFRYLEAMCG